MVKIVIPATPVIRFTSLIPSLPPNKAVKALVEQEAVSEVRRALNAWAYGEVS
jgi:hypothetical protein